MKVFEKLECFKIQILKTKHNNSLNIHNYEPIHQVPCEAISVSAEPTMIAADPFLFVHDDRLYLFYERKPLYHDGVLLMESTSDLEDWTEPVMVLKERFHLSYPWVFEEEGHIYMIPETCGDRSIRLYESDSDCLSSFHLVKKLIVQPETENLSMSYSDTSIYKKEGTYYLHTAVGVDGVNQLRLYCADSLFGPYIQHASSPIVTDNHYGRNAGCLFDYGGMLLRPAQDCVARYGDNVHLMKVERMTEAEYREVPYKEDVIDTSLGFYREGGHQFNAVEFRGYTVLATDAKEYHRYFFNRLLHKFGKYR